MSMNTKYVFSKPDVEINLGAIGKGWAIDKAVDHIEMEGIENFLIHGGHSSVRSRGTRGLAGQKTEQNGWPVGLRHPLPSREADWHNYASEQSARHKRIWHRSFFIEKGQKIGHILDPRTGQPASGVLSATVLADTAAEADALATAAYIPGPARN